ncbi:sensor histidine kinase [Halobacterium jilantaiense]|uniref:histidine kinase n=1 Tax=Halobacterium jilantaiense TaxID=355548 RepID=A0A1I0MSX2_9EURY|nr:HAMP domain-containing sensor histidine kinase [Halobacterium jilantaiense]SEV91372.1 Signal transduction histidine kinase [Halobacterium jilantaiense]
MTLLGGVSSSRPAWRLVEFAVVLAAAVVVEAVVRVATGVGLTLPFLAGLVTLLPFLAGIAYAGQWLADSKVDAARHGRVLRWTTSSAAASVVVNVVLMAVLPVASTMQAVAWLRWALVIGAGVGALIGVTEARAVQHASDAARSETRAAHFERERDRLDYLNSLLRHEILNATNEISGYARLLHESHEPGSRVHEFSGRIDSRTSALTSVIDDVSVLLQASREPDDVGTVDAVAVVLDETARLEDTYDAADVSVDAPATATVAADCLVSRAVRALLENAVVHDDATETSVSVTVDASVDWVTVRVRDDSGGISEDAVESLFERPSRRTADHQLGLYTATKLVEGYGGDLELVETGDDGSTFEVRLPAAGSNPTVEPQHGPKQPVDLG